MSIPHSHQNRKRLDTLDLNLEFDHKADELEESLALLALTHSVTEHRLYLAMLRETSALNSRVAMANMNRLASLAGLCSFNTVRHSIAGLINKLSIERQQVVGDGNRRFVYLVFKPAEIFARRRAARHTLFHQDLISYLHNPTARLTIKRITENFKFTRREAHVALLCTEGLSNAQIAEKLCVSEQTIKFHLKHIFVKCGVKRRAELISRLLTSQ
jgi:DNA-binding CsgD family transcriptional regulator